MAKKNKTLESGATLLSAYQETFKSPLGRKVLLDLIKNNYGLETTFDENPQKMAYQEGQRSVVLRIFATLKVNIKEYLENIEEINKPDDSGIWG